jgi:hypothetical protein
MFSSWTDLSILFRKKCGTGFGLRDQRGIESSSFSSFILVLDYDYEDDDEDGINKNAFNSAKRGMKAFDEFRPAPAGRTGLILLFAEKRPETLGADERNQTGILTAASNLIPPSRCRWLLNL